MAGVIKAGQLYEGSGTAEVVAFNFEDMTRKAEAYIEGIRRQAARILDEARQRVAVLEQEARASGRQAAQRDALQSAQAELDRQVQTLLPALARAIEAIGQARESWLRHWERNTVHLAAAIAARVIRRELSRTPEIPLEWMREALELVTDEGRVTVYLHPQDFEALGESARRLTDRLARSGVSQIEPDPSVERGGCRVETEFGCIDQQVGVQLQRIEDELTSD